MQTFWSDPHRALSVLVLPWSLSCQRSCTPSLRTSWTGTSPRGNARRRRKRRGTVSTRRSLTKRWRPQRSLCSPPKLSYCQRRYWKSDLHKKLGHLCLLFVCLSSSESNNIFAPFLFFCSFVFYFNFLSVALLEYCPAATQVQWRFSVDVYGSVMVLKEGSRVNVPPSGVITVFLLLLCVTTEPFGKLLLVDSRIFIFPKDPERRPLTFILVPPSCNHHSCTQE